MAALDPGRGSRLYALGAVGCCMEGLLMRGGVVPAGAGVEESHFPWPAPALEAGYFFRACRAASAYQRRAEPRGCAGRGVAVTGLRGHPCVSCL